MNKYIFDTAIQRRAQQATMLKSLAGIILLGAGFVSLLILILGKW